MLVDSDSVLGSVGNYGSQIDRGLDLNGADYLSISADLRTLNFSLTISGDELLQFRVLTEQVIAGDFNNDGHVNGVDLAIWQNNYGLGNAADADGDGDTDGHDFLTWQRQVTPSGNAAAVPEPSSSLIMFVGLVTYLSRLGRSERRLVL